MWRDVGDDVVWERAFVFCMIHEERMISDTVQVDDFIPILFYGMQMSGSRAGPLFFLSTT